MADEATDTSAHDQGRRRRSRAVAWLIVLAGGLCLAFALLRPIRISRVLRAFEVETDSIASRSVGLVCGGVDCVGSETVAQTAAARPAEEFLSSLGVNTHLGSGEPAYQSPPTILRALDYLGVTQVRDQLLLRPDARGEYEILANAGVRFDFLMPDGMSAPTFASAAAAFAARHPASIISLEGPNEVDIQPYEFNGGANLSSLAAFHPYFYRTLKGAPGLAQVPVLGVSISQQTKANLAAVGDISQYCDFANSHAYVSSGASPWPVITDYIGRAQTMAPRRPVIITETGYNNTLRDSMSGVSEEVQARYTLDTLFDAYAQGVRRTYVYELFDEAADRSIAVASFGLYRWSGAPKTAATAIHNLTAILEDEPGGAPAHPATLTYSLGEFPGQGHSLVLQKADGRLILVVWAEPPLWNPLTHTPVAASTVKVDVTIARPFGRIRVFDPLLGSGAVAVYRRTSSLQVDLSDHPVLIELSPQDGNEAGGQATR